MSTDTRGHEAPRHHHWAREPAYLDLLQWLVTDWAKEPAYLDLLHWLVTDWAREPAYLDLLQWLITDWAREPAYLDGGGDRELTWPGHLDTWVQKWPLVHADL